MSNGGFLPFYHLNISHLGNTPFTTADKAHKLCRLKVVWKVLEAEETLQV